MLHWSKPSAISFDSRRNTDRKSKLRISGTVKVYSLPLVLFCLFITMAASVSIPMERASVFNQVATTGPIYFPHVDMPLDSYHFYADPEGDQNRRVFLVFCKDKGFAPPFDEGETVKWMRYRPWDQDGCLELLGFAGMRDPNTHELVRK